MDDSTSTISSFAKTFPNVRSYKSDISGSKNVEEADQLILLWYEKALF